MKLNFIMEFNSIMRYSRNNALPLRERMLLIALFYIANDRAIYDEGNQTYDWPEDFIPITNGELELYSTLDKRAIDALRNNLKQRGVIDFKPGMKNSRPPMYRMNYLSANVGCKIVPNDAPNYVPNNDTNHAPNYVPNNDTNHAPNMSPYSINKEKEKEDKTNSLSYSLIPKHPPANQFTDTERENIVSSLLKYAKDTGKNVTKSDVWTFIAEQDARGWKDGSGQPVRDVLIWFDGWIQRIAREDERLNVGGRVYNEEFFQSSQQEAIDRLMKGE